MKMKLVLLSIAVAISADCHAMFRRAPAKTAAPKAQKAPQRLFSFSRNHENRLAMPMVAGNRLNPEMVTAISKHQELSNKKNQIAKEIKMDKRRFALLSAFCVPYAVIGLVTPVEAGALSCMALVPVICEYRDIKDAIKQQKSIEEELADLVAEQKRILRVPEDKQ